MKPNIIIRADGGASIGMGHVIRCLALAEMLKNDFTITFAIQEPAESIVKNIHTATEMIIHLPQTNDYNKDAIHFSQFLNPSYIVLLDGYNFKTDYQKIIKDKGCKLVCIDDLHEWHFFADAIINHADDVDKSLYSSESYTKLYLGLNYALLRKVFLEHTSVKKINEVKKVFISMGAADSTNLTGKFAESLLGINDIEEIHLMLGSVNPNLKSIDLLLEKNKKVNILKHFDISANELALLLKSCDIAICPASTISIESCAIGIGLVSGYTAVNQLDILDGLIKNNTIVNIGDMNALSVSQIRSKFEDIVREPEQFNILIENQKKMIDGRSSKRLKKVFKNLIMEKLHFRFAKESDVDLYYKWTNDFLVRSNSFNPNMVEYHNHAKWFLLKLNSKECHFYLFFNEENVPVGQIRIDSNEKETTIGISIDEAFRGKSLGIEMLKSATLDYLHKHPTAIIVAYIKQENIASYNIFRNVGFSNEEIVMEQGVKSYKLHKKNI